MEDFGKKLLALQRQGNLSVADLQHWFARPYSTVRSWVVDKRAPRYAGHDAEESLRLLHYAIKDFEGLRGVSSHVRPGRIRKIHATWVSRIPKSSSTLRRV